MESTFLLNYASMGMFIQRLHSNILMIYTDFGHYFFLFSSWIGFVHLLFLVVAKLYSHLVTDTAERSGLDLPVPDRVVKETDAIVEHPLHPKTCWAEVIHPNIGDVV